MDHLIFLFFFIFPLLILFLYKKIFLRATIIDPFVVVTFFYLLCFVISPYYFCFVDYEYNDNYDFYSKDYSAYFSSLMISAVGFIFFSLGYFICRIWLPVSLLDYKLVVLRSDYSLSTIFSLKVVAFILIVSKAYFVFTNQLGSLESFILEENKTGSYFLNIFRSFFLFSPIILAYFSFVYIKFKREKLFFLFLLISEIILSFIMGNRRDLFIFLLPFLLIQYTIYDKIKMGLITKLLLTIFILIFFYVSTVLAFIMGNVDKSGSMDYIVLVNLAFDNFTNLSNFDPIILPNTVFGWANQIQLVNSARVLYYNHINLDYLHFLDFIQNSVIIRFKMLTYDITELPEYILFKQTLVRSGEIPYLTNPIFAESFLLGGWVSLVIYSFFYGMICHLFFKLGSKNLVYIFFYFSFYFVFTFGMLQSFNSSGLVGAMKTLTVLLVFIFLSKFSLKKDESN